MIDVLRIFCFNWRYSVAIELTLALVLIVHLVRNEPLEYMANKYGPREINFAVKSGGAAYNNSVRPVGSDELLQAYPNAIGTALPDFQATYQDDGIEAYIKQRMSVEMSKLHPGGYVSNRPPTSIWAQYRERVQQLGQFIEAPVPLPE